MYILDGISYTPRATKGHKFLLTCWIIAYNHKFLGSVLVWKCHSSQKDKSSPQKLEGIKKSYLRGYQDSGFPETFGIWANIMYNYIFCFYSRLCIHQSVNVGVCIYFILCKICSYILHHDCSFILFLIIMCVTKSIIFRRRKIVKEVFCSCRYFIYEKANEIDLPSKKQVHSFSIPLLSTYIRKFWFLS